MFQPNQPKNPGQPESPPTTTPPPSPSGDASADSSATDDPERAGEHIARIPIADDLDSEQAGAGGDNPAPAAGVIPYEVFHRGFCGTFNYGSAKTQLRSLAVDEADPTSLAASRAIYDTALDWPALRFLIEPRNKWMKRAAVLGAFAVPIAVGVRLELAQRRKDRPAGVSVPANDNTPTSDAENAAPPPLKPDPTGQYDGELEVAP